jgi:xylono-1,5-lactonase
MLPYRIITRPLRDELGEGPYWSRRENAVFWVDVLGQYLHRLSLADEVIMSWKMPDVIGWAIERTQGGFVCGMGREVFTLNLDPFTLTPFADLETQVPDNRINDAKADAFGRLWAGTMPFGADKPTGNLYRIDPDGSVHGKDKGYQVTNGPAIDPEGAYLYHTNTSLGQVYKFALSSSGELGPRELFLQFKADWGKPDGMTFDAEGGLWIAHWGGGRISRFLADGSLDEVINLPTSQITSCCFAGENLERMFVTSAAIGLQDETHAGALFEVKTGRRGLLPHRFAG